jgi:predicted permease
VEKLLLVVGCLLAGVLARKTGRVPARAPELCTKIVIWVALPALTLRTIHDLPVSWDRLRALGVAFGTPLLIFLVAALTFLPLARALAWPRATTACLLLTAGLANTSFVGFPLVEALFGAEGLAQAVLVDQGQFLVLCTLGTLVVGAAREAGDAPAHGVARRLFGFPPFVAFLLAIAARPVALPAPLTALLDTLALLIVPLALFAVGWQLRIDARELRADARLLTVGLSLRLVLAPLVVFLIVQRVLGETGIVGDVAVAEAAMAPMVTGALLALEANLAPRLATAMVGLGVPLSLATVPIWAWLLRG